MLYIDGEGLIPAGFSALQGRCARDESTGFHNLIDFPGGKKDMAELTQAEMAVLNKLIYVDAGHAL